MCGILGGRWTTPPPDIDERIAATFEASLHRGPDDKGCEYIYGKNQVTVLGHTRLSILELGPAGHQPMISPNRRYWLTFNGEIYNYRELRRELEQHGHAFTTHTDTEVLLAAWQQWGEQCLTRLIGMFAFAILDTTTQTLTCVCDPFGIKPLYWSEHEGFIFASEPAALNALAGRRARQLNWQVAYDYLVHGAYDHSPATFTAHQSRLPAGHLLVVNAVGAATLRRWWAPNINEQQGRSLEENAQILRELLLDSVRLHLRSDVPLGAALSGGIDSTAIVGAIRYLEPDLPIHTVSFVCPGTEHSEDGWIDLVNRSSATHPHKITVADSDLTNDIDDLIRAQGEPFGSTSIYAQYRVFKEARDLGLTVMLEGQGADELFAGYQGYPEFRLQSLIDRGQWGQALAFFNAWAQWPGRSRLRLVQQTGALFLGDAFYQYLRSWSGRTRHPAWLRPHELHSAGVRTLYPLQRSPTPAPARRVVQELARGISGRGLPELLRHGDRNAMAFSIENRVPFLTTSIARFAHSLPEEQLISMQGSTKHVLRHALRGIIPEAVIERRDKIGFVTPERRWMENLAPTARQWLSAGCGMPFLDERHMLSAFDAVLEGKARFSWQLWRWVNFVRWVQLNDIQP